MERLKAIPTTPAVLRRKHAVNAFKVCPLCDGLNLKENEECYVCRWSGEFDHGPILVSSRLQAILDRCPELSVVMESRQPRLHQRIFKGIKQLFTRFRRRIDLLA